MPHFIRGLLIAPLLATAGCTHILSSPEVRTTDGAVGLNGAQYALPMLQLKLDATRMLASCPTPSTFAHGRESVTIVEPSLAFSLKVAPTATQVPGERYTVDYAALSSFLKTTSFGVETFPSGTLKSMNVSADDQTAGFIGDVVGLGLSVAGVIAGAPVIPQNLGVKNNGALSFDGSAPSRDQLSRRLDAAVRALKASSVDTPLWTCTSDTVEALAALHRNAAEQKKAAAALTKATAKVQRLTIVAGLRRSRNEDVLALGAALEEQEAQTLTLADLVEAQADLTSPLSRSRTDLWPGRPTELSSTITTPDADAEFFAKLLRREVVRTITPENLAIWRSTLSADVLAFIAQDESAEAIRALMARYLRDDGTARTEAGGFGPCASSSIGDLKACLRGEMSLDVALRQTDPARAVCGTAANAGPCVQAVDVHEGRHGNGRRSNDGIADPGLFIRPPELGDFEACRSGFRGAATCPSKFRVARLERLSAPQLGQLRFLPFHNAVFEASQLSFELREDGSIAKLEYKRPRAAGLAAAAAAREAVGQYVEYGDKRDADRRTALTTARTDEIASIQFDIDKLTKQKALLAAQKLEEPDASAAIKAETAAIEAQVALLNAKLAQAKAEAALT